MANLVVEDQDGRVVNEWRFGGTVECRRDGWSERRQDPERRRAGSANREKCIEASRKMLSVLARHANSEASTITRTVTELDGVEARGKLHENQSTRTMVRLFRVHRECMYTEARERRESGDTGNHAVEEKWKAMMSELGKDAKIPDLWRMLALLEISPKDVS